MRSWGGQGLDTRRHFPGTIESRVQGDVAEDAVGLKELVVRTSMYRPARWIDRHLLRPSQGRLFRTMTSFYSALLPRGALCFDIGANIGEVSEACLAVGARVIALEPQPGCAAELEARCGHYPDFSAIRAAVAAKPGIARLHIHADHGSSSLSPSWMGGSANVTASVDVPVVSLAALVAYYGLPYYCKIDVEGSEEEVLSTLPAPIPLLSFEYHRSGVERALHCLARIRQLMTSDTALEVNLTPAEGFVFRFSNWIPWKEFADGFRDYLSGDTAPYGDVWARPSQSPRPSGRDDGNT
jgi:FkbM family methyltransferase